MSAIADGIDFLMEFVTGKSSNIKAAGVKDQGAYRSASGLLMLVFSFMWLVVWQQVSQKDFSALTTVAAVVQCFGFIVMSMKVRLTKSVAGLSSRSMQMFVIYLGIRLCSTTLKRGYIPVDRSGHYFYQFMDFCTVALAAHLVYCCHKTYRHSYQEEHDTLPLKPMVVVGVILACFIHSNLNRSFFFDTVWFTSLNLETVALLPQLWMMANIGGHVSSISAQFVACNALNKVLVGTFWLWAHSEVSRSNAHGDPTNISGKMICTAYIVQLLLSGDFMFYYVKSFFDDSDEVEIPEAPVGVEM